MVLPVGASAALHAALHSLELLSWVTGGARAPACPSLHCRECPVLIEHHIPVAVTDSLAFAQGAYTACEGRSRGDCSGCPTLFWAGVVVGVFVTFIVLVVVFGVFTVLARTTRRQTGAPAEAAEPTADPNPVGAFLRGAARPWRASSPATPARLKSLRDADA